MSTEAIQPTESTNEPVSNSTLLLLLSGIVLVAYLPTLIIHYQTLWELEQYQYFPFILGAVGWLSWTRWKEATLADESAPRPWYRRALQDRLPVVLVVLAFVTLAVAVYCHWGWFAAVSFNLLTGAGLLVLSKHFHVRNAWGIWCLMWLVVPPPIEFGANVVQRLQLASSLISSQILDLLRIDHLMSGNIFTLPTKQLFVDEACSGIVSVMSVIAATGIYAVWKDRSLFHAGLLMLISVGWALVMNSVRIVTIAIAEARFQTDLAEGTPHEILGLVLFSLTFVASMSTDQLLEFVLTPIQTTRADSATVRHNPLVKLWNWWASCFTPQVMEPNEETEVLNRRLTGVLTPKLLIVTAPIAIFGIWSAAVFFGAFGGKPTARVEALTLSQSIEEGTLPEEIGSWLRSEYERKDKRGDNLVGNYDFGQFSNSFTYTQGGGQAMVSMDFPFTGGWHELSACYRAAGWDIVQRKALSENGHEFVETQLKFPDQEQYGYLLFSNFDEQGEALLPPNDAILIRSWFFVRRRFFRKIAGDVYQAQVFIPSAEPLTEQERADARALFMATEAKLTDHIAQLAASNPGK